MRENGRMDEFSFLAEQSAELGVDAPRSAV
jgi:hypothetical protein